MTLTADEYWMIAVGALVNASCGVLGCYLLLRRLSLLGDAIAHAILPGLVLAFMITGSRDIFPMFIGAMIVGTLTAFLSQSIHRIAKVPEDASMGVVFTSLFALGVIMITRTARDVDLDPGCVLYGLIEFVPLDVVTHFGIDAPRAFWSLLIVTGLVIAFVVILYKELRIVSFDAHLATTMGIRAALVHYLLMAMVAGTTVAAFESVGSILVVAMLIVPGATAHLLTDRLDRMLMIAAIHGVVSSAIGTLLAVYWNTSVAGMMSVVAGGLFTVALITAPRYGLLSMWLHRTALTVRVVREDILAMLYRWQEKGSGVFIGSDPSTAGSRVKKDSRPLSPAQVVRAVGGGLTVRFAVWRLRRRGFLRTEHDAVTLTHSGLRRAKGLVRSHRLWETYLAEHFDLPLDHLHAPAERMEHFVTPQMRERMAADVADPTTDPHGRSIPE